MKNIQKFLILIVTIILFSCNSNSTKGQSVEIDKPHALRFADSVSVKMEYQRDVAINNA